MEIEGEIGFGAGVKEYSTGRKTYTPIMFISINGEKFEFECINRQFTSEKEVSDLADLVKAVFMNIEKDNIHHRKEGEPGFTEAELTEKIKETRKENRSKPLYDWDDQDNTMF